MYQSFHDNIESGTHEYVIRKCEKEEVFMFVLFFVLIINYYLDINNKLKLLFAANDAGIKFHICKGRNYFSTIKTTLLL